MQGIFFVYNDSVPWLISVNKFRFFTISQKKLLLVFIAQKSMQKWLRYYCKLKIFKVFYFHTF